MDKKEKIKMQHDKLDRIIEQLLLTHDEQACLLDKEKTVELTELIIEIIKARYDIRYCTHKRCACHPEYHIKTLLIKYDRLNKLLEKENLLSDIVEHCEEYVNLESVFDKYETQ